MTSNLVPPARLLGLESLHRVPNGPTVLDTQNEQFFGFYQQCSILSAIVVIDNSCTIERRRRASIPNLSHHRDFDNIIFVNPNRPIKFPKYSDVDRRFIRTRLDDAEPSGVKLPRIHYSFCPRPIPEKYLVGYFYPVDNNEVPSHSHRCAVFLS
jgi:hypothetical protein